MLASALLVSVESNKGTMSQHTTAGGPKLTLTILLYSGDWMLGVGAYQIILEMMSEGWAHFGHGLILKGSGFFYRICGCGLTLTFPR